MYIYNALLTEYTVVYLTLNVLNSFTMNWQSDSSMISFSVKEKMSVAFVSTAKLQFNQTTV
jgi:hypothetical protein